MPKTSLDCKMRCRLLRKVLNFVFLRTLLYLVKTYFVQNKTQFCKYTAYIFPLSKKPRIFWKPYVCLFAKNEKRQKCRKFNTYSIFKTTLTTLRVVIFLFINGKHNLVEYFGVFQGLYRQSDSLMKVKEYFYAYLFC